MAFTRSIVLPRLLLSLTGILTSFLMLEVGCRVADLWYIPDYSKMNWYAPSPFPGVPYVLKPNLNTRWGHGVIESLDLIRDTHALVKKPGCYRILALGDSITFGLGVDQKDTFPKALEANLNARNGRKFEIINAGIPGYNIMDAAAFLPHLLEIYKPDLVIWTLVPNDYDDSLGLDAEGTIAFANVDYVSNEDALRNWGYEGQAAIDVKDFRFSMSAQALAWADGQAGPSSIRRSIDSWLAQHALIYAWAKHLLAKQPLTSAGGHEALYLADYTGKDGARARWPAFSPIYSSPASIAHVRRALAEVAQLADRERISVILLNTALPIDEDWRNRPGRVRYFDIAPYLGEPFYQFLKENNLGWDGHFSSTGNKKFAGAVARLLICNDYVVGSDSCKGMSEAQAGMETYWNAFREARLGFIQKNYGEIDFDVFRGVHQVVGGIFPPRIFPGLLARRANILLPAGSRHINVTGTLGGNQPLELVLTAFSGANSSSKEFVAKPGEIELSMDIPGQYVQGVEPIELQLKCTKEICPPARLHKIQVQ